MDFHCLRAEAVMERELGKKPSQNCIQLKGDSFDLVSKEMGFTGTTSHLS